MTSFNSLPTAAADTAFGLFETVLGHCGLAWRGDVVTGVQLPEADEAATRLKMQRRFPDAPEAAAPPAMATAMSAIAASLRGEAVDLSAIPLDMTSVPAFHQRVYAVALAIPAGSTLTYGEIAAQLGERGAARAVGQALGRNPFAPVVPCHRVLGASGKGTGFSAGGGLATKFRMLQSELAHATEPDLFR
jgi:methylated-DNA-[protein]-cysteine S-methyltransferase